MAARPSPDDGWRPGASPEPGNLSALAYVVRGADEMSVPGSPWTTQELQLLAQLRAQGASVQQCADKLGRSRRATKHMLVTLHPRYGCPTCGLVLPAHEFPWSPAPGVPPCRSCRDRRTPRAAPVVVAEPVEVVEPVTRAGLLPRSFRKREAVIDVVVPIVVTGPPGHREMTMGSGSSGFMVRCQCTFAGVVRRTRDLALTDAEKHGRRVKSDPERERFIMRLTSEIAAGTYRPPSQAQWVERFADIEVVGQILHDMIAEAKAAEQPKGTRQGRRPGVSFDMGEAWRLIPPALRHMLPAQEQ